MPSGRTQVIHEGHILNVLALGPLSARLQTSKIDTAMSQGVKLVKCRATCEYTGKAAAEGPVTVGLAVGLDATQIAEALKSDPQQFNDPGRSEPSNRKVFPIWVMNKNATATKADPDLLQAYTNVGVPMWDVLEDEAVEWWAHNDDDTNTLTTGGVVKIKATWVVRWLHD